MLTGKLHVPAPIELVAMVWFLSKGSGLCYCVIVSLLSACEGWLIGEILGVLFQDLRCVSFCSGTHKIGQRLVLDSASDLGAFQDSRADLYRPGRNWIFGFRHKMKIKGYKLVIEPADRVERAVNDLLKQGWQPYGPPSVLPPIDPGPGDRDMVFQAMIREDD